MPFSSIAIPFAHDFERFDSGVDVFDHDSLPRQLAILRLLSVRQRVMFTFFVGNPAVRVQRQQALITAVGQQQNRQNDRPNRHFKQTKIMHRTFRLGRAENFLRFGVCDNLRFDHMPLFFARIPGFLVFFGRSIGLSVTSTTSVRPAFFDESNAFFPGK